MRTLAVYPGTFDPVTTGHLDLIRRSSEVFSKVIVAVAGSTQKKALFTVEERMHMLRNATAGLERIEIGSFEGLLVEYIKSTHAHVVVRGLRAIADFEYEFQLAQMNRKLYPDFEIVYMMPGEKYTYISSSLAKEVALLGGDISELIPGEIKEYFLETLKTRKTTQEA